MVLVLRAARRRAELLARLGQRSGFASDVTPPPSSMDGIQTAPPPEKTWAGRKLIKERPLGNLSVARLEYKRQVAALRQKYRLEVEKQKVESEQQLELKKERIAKAREEREAIKQQRREEVRLKHQENAAALRDILEEQRLRRAENFRASQASVAERKEREKARIRRASCSWIEEKDLEMKILESMVEPVRLIGTSTPSFENFEGIGSTISRTSKAKEDPLLRDSDDELLSAFGDRPKRSPKVTGQDILASVTKATTKLQF